MSIYLTIILSALFVNNVVLSQNLGVCSFIGVSDKVKSSYSMGLVVTLVLSISSLVCYTVYKFVLIPLDIEFLDKIISVFIIAGIVQILEVLLKKYLPSTFLAFGIYLPLITTNCVILGTILLSLSQYDSVLQVFANSFFTGLGYAFAITLFAFIRTKVNINSIPKPFRGLPIALIIAGFLALAFSGLTGIV